jgi:hypothetical protein
MKKIILIIVSLFLIIFLIDFIILNIEKFEMDAYVVENEAGFNLDSDKIHFGNVPVGSGGAFREMSVTNVYDEKVKIYLIDFGNIDEQVYFEIDGGSYESYGFILDVNETKNFRLIFRNEDTLVGDYYSGTLRIVTQKLII